MSNKSDMCKTDNKLKAKRKQERQNKRRARHARNS